MSLLSYQTTLTIGKLYELSDLPECVRMAQCKPNIWFKGGTINIYTSNSTTQPTALTAMTLSAGDTGLVEDINSISPNAHYISIIQASGTTIEITLTGINATDKGSIS